MSLLRRASPILLLVEAKIRRVKEPPGSFPARDGQPAIESPRS